MSFVAARSLKDRYARSKGRLAELEHPSKWKLRNVAARAAWAAASAERTGRIAEIRQELAELAAVIRQLEPSWADADTPAIRPHIRRRELPHGDFTHTVYGVIGDAKEPLTSSELVKIVCALRGLSRDTTVKRENMADNVRKALKRLEKDGLIAHDGGKPQQWLIIDDDGSN